MFGATPSTTVAPDLGSLRALTSSFAEFMLQRGVKISQLIESAASECNPIRSPRQANLIPRPTPLKAGCHRRQ
jgi:hypothetical protein